MRAGLHVFLYARWQLRSGKGRVLECNDRAAKSAQRRPSWEWISAVGACPLDQRMNAVLTSESIHQRTTWCVSGAANQTGRVAVGGRNAMLKKKPIFCDAWRKSCCADFWMFMEILANARDLMPQPVQEQERDLQRLWQGARSGCRHRQRRSRGAA